MRRLWLSLAMLGVGGALMVAAQLAGASSERKGGVFVVGTTGASVQIDPQLSYITTAWWLEYATAAKLYNYPDKRGGAGASSCPRSPPGSRSRTAGKRYTFFIRKGFRFSDGTPVTARNFEYAIDRVANHDLASPGAQFITDPKGTDIVGAKDVNEGNGTHVTGVRVKGNRLIINLTKSDGTFLSKITMPFFQATSTKLPLDREIVTVDSITDIPSAGPYALVRNDPDVLTSLRRNPYWTARPRSAAPAEPDRPRPAVEPERADRLQPDARGRARRGPAPGGGTWSKSASRFGVNRTRFWTKPVNCTGFLPMNMVAALVPRATRSCGSAINYAISRRDYVAQAGPYAGQPWTHLFNPGVPGWTNVNPYPLDPDLPKARALAAGHFRDGKITVSYRSSGTTNPAQAAIVRQDLINLGFDPANITMMPFSRRLRLVRPDAATSPISASRWAGARTIRTRTTGSTRFCRARRRHDRVHSVNYSRMDLPKWNAKMDAAAKLVGRSASRSTASSTWTSCDEVAPMAVERTYNNRYFFSDRVDPKSLVYQGIYQDWSIPALALK